MVTSAGVGRLGLGFVASLVIARALGPADFGVYAVLAASVAVIGGLAEGGLTEAAVLRVSAVWPGDQLAAKERARVLLVAPGPGGGGRGAGLCPGRARIAQAAAER